MEIKVKKILLNICLFLTIIVIGFSIGFVVSTIIIHNPYYEIITKIVVTLELICFIILCGTIGKLKDIKNQENAIIVESVKQKNAAFEEMKKLSTKLMKYWEIMFYTSNICFNYKSILASQRLKTKRKDVYGNISYENWQEEVANFYEKVILRDLINYREYIENINEPDLNLKESILKTIDELSKRAETELYEERPDTKNMDGQTYEVFVAELLTKRNFEVQLTKTTGDQGVDIIAKKNGITFAIQCKRYSHKVGNAAVQEVISGMKFYKTNFGAVVTNSQYSKSAIELANVSNIMLLHDTELNKLDSVLS